MNTRTWLVLGAVLACAACSDDDTNDTNTTPMTTTTSGAGATGGTSSSGGTAGVGGQGGSGGAAGGAGGAGGEGGAGGGGGEAFACTTARETALGPIDAVSTGAVSVISDEAGVKEIYVDASAGGFQMASMNPAVYVDLANASRVDVTDMAAFEDATWDLAIKRVAIRNNSAHVGAGNAAAAFLAGVAFADVDLADAMSATLVQEELFDDVCEYEVDATGAIVTSMSDWYDYNPQMMTLAPKDGVFVVRGADGTAFYKLEILEYYADPDGTPGLVSGRYVLRVAAL